MEDISSLHRFIGDYCAEDQVLEVSIPNIVVVEDDQFLGKAIYKFLSGFDSCYW